MSSPEAGSNIVSGLGTNTALFKLPGSPPYFVQSVVATVDNAAGGDTLGTLTMADTNGEVIADKTQGTVIPAGGSGRATWALRLADEGQGGGGFVPTLANSLGVYSGQFGAVDGAQPFPWGWADGAVLLDETTPTDPLVLVSGVYALNMKIDQGAAGGSTAARVEIGFEPADPFGVTPLEWAEKPTGASAWTFLWRTYVGFFDAGTPFRLTISYPLIAAPNTVRHDTRVVRIT